MRGLALITLTGRRTRAQHTLPVSYKQDGQKLTIPVMWPERKLWWRNLRDGAGVRVRLRGVERSGHATAVVDEQGGVSVEVILDGGG